MLDGTSVAGPWRSTEKCHAVVGLPFACRQPGGERADMRLQLVAVRVEEIEGIAFAAILLPRLHPVLQQPFLELLEIVRAD